MRKSFLGLSLLLVVVALTGCFHKNELPVAKIGANPTSGIAPLTVQFSGSNSSDADGKIVEYNWDFGDGSNGTGISTSHTYTKKGLYTVVLTVKDDKGGTHSANVAISVDENKTPTAKLSANPATGFAPLEVDFDGGDSSDPDGDALTYRWDFGDGSAVQENNSDLATHTYEKAGTFTAKLTVKDTKGATSAPAQVTIKVEAKPIVTTKTDKAEDDLHQMTYERTYPINIEVGKEFTVTVKVTANVDLAGLIVNEGPLPAGLVLAKGDLSDLKGFQLNLAKGSSFTMTYTLKATQAGELTVSGKASGVTQAGGAQVSVPLASKLQSKVPTGSGSN